MAAQPLRRAAACFFLNRLEHSSQISRIVASPRHDLRAEQIRLLFVLAAVLQERGAKAELAALRDHLPPAAADNGAGNCAGKLAELKSLRLGGIRSPMPEEHVTQLVSHHADNFTFSGRRFEHAAVDEHRAARQRERVDLLEIHRRKRVFEHRIVQVRRRRGDEPLAQPIEVTRERRVGDDRILLPYFGRGFATELDVLLRRVLVLGRRDLRLRASQLHDENGG